MGPNRTYKVDMEKKERKVRAEVDFIRERLPSGASGICRLGRRRLVLSAWACVASRAASRGYRTDPSRYSYEHHSQTDVRAQKAQVKSSSRLI